MNRPKLPKREFKDRERDMNSFLNGMANTIDNIIDYLEKDRKATDSVLDSKRESELTVQERQNRKNMIQEDLSDLKKRINQLEREKIRFGNSNT